MFIRDCRGARQEIRKQVGAISVNEVRRLEGLNQERHSASESHSVASDSLQSHGLYNPWTSPGQNTGVGSLPLLQGILNAGYISKVEPV